MPKPFGFAKQKAPAASLERRKWGLDVQIHMKMILVLIDIRYYTLLVLNSALYINYIVLAIIPAWGIAIVLLSVREEAGGAACATVPLFIAVHPAKPPFSSK